MPNEFDQYKVKSSPPKSKPVADSSKEDFSKYKVIPGKGDQTASEPINLNEAPAGEPDQGNLLRNMLASFTLNASVPAEAAIRSIGAWDTYPEAYKMVQKSLEGPRLSMPGTTLAAELVSGGLPFLIPGVGEAIAPAEAPAYALKTAQALKMAESLPYLQRIKTMLPFMGEGAKIGAKTGATYGAASGLLGSKYSFFDPTNDQNQQVSTFAQVARPLLGAAQSTVEGALGGGFFGASGAPVSAATKPLTDAILRSAPVRLLSGVRKDVSEEVLPHISAYHGAFKDEKQFGAEAVAALNKKSAEVTQARNEARQLLDTEKPAMRPVEAKMKIYQGLREGNVLEHDANGVYSSVGGKSAVNQFRTIQREVDRIAGDKGYLSEADVRLLMDKVKPHTNFNESQSAQPAKGKLVADGWNIVHGKMNEALKGQNKPYADAMNQVAQDVNMLERTRKAMGVRRAEYNAEGNRYEANDTTYSRLKNLRNRDASAATLDEFAKNYLGGEDIIGMSNRVRNENLLSSKSPGFFSILGMGSGGKVMPLLGAARDVAGRPAWAAIAKGLSGAHTGLLPAMGASLFSNATLKPEYFGTPFGGGFSAEDYRLASTMTKEEFDAYRKRKAEELQNANSP